VTFGALCLIATNHLEAEKADADWDVSAAGQIVGCAGLTVFDRESSLGSNK
jgi:hypothetical protein